MTADDDAASLVADAKRLMRVTRAAALSTLGPDGTPFASLAQIASMPDGSPILLLSRLAHHTRHLEADGRCSLLLAASGLGDPLAHPRLTLVGRAKSLDGETRALARRRFLARNPKAELYADFSDFSFWRLELESAHLNGGFARAASFAPATILTDVSGCDALLGAEDGAVAHMNADHQDAIQLYATRLIGLPDREWHLTGLDPDGLDLASGDLIGRLDFPARVADGASLRRLLVDLVAEARARPT